ncbi:MAG: hydantoinase/oxoprolinase family protein [Actinobacteria bacterium]|nr:hydantoinase/oxoprolinase family protein [Actinomycetota bacterium]
MSEARYAVGVDVGGTFTDLVALTADGRTLVAKVPSTPGDQSVGVVNGLQDLAGREKLDLPEFLGSCGYLVHGTTVATNIMLEFNGARTGVITTKGFRDIIDIRRNYKETDFDIRLPPPTPIAPRRVRKAVEERVDYAGGVLIPLNEDDVARAVDELKTFDIESVAVCYLFSFLNPSHELRTREIILEIDPTMHVSLSHEVLPRVREFERFSTTLVDAYVTPGLSRYLHQLEDKLRGLNFSGDLFVMAANGGMVSVEQGSRQGVQLVLSGPAGGIVAGVEVGKITGIKDIITIDMGGTSFDTCLISDWTPTVAGDSWLSRYRIAIPTLDIHPIGAGGGSIASVDEAGRLRVGPESAGAIPGPACYGRGGHLPAVTDADVCLGLIGTSSFLGGAMKLDRDAALEAVETHVAKGLGLDVTEAAAGIVRMVNNNMANGIREVSMKRGHDPRDFALVAFGGAGPVHAGRLAEQLGVQTVLIPRGQASVLSAFGDVLSDVRISKARGFYARSSRVDVAELNRLLEATVADAMAEIEGISVEGTRIDVSFEMHYKLQTHEIMVPADAEGGHMTEAGFAATLDRFHDIHERLYTFKKPGQEVELLGIQVDLWGLRTRPSISTGATSSNEDPYVGTRAVYFEELGGFKDDTPVVAGLRLEVGAGIHGPAIVEEPHTTIVVAPSMSLSVTDELVYTLAVEV